MLLRNPHPLWKQCAESALQSQLDGDMEAAEQQYKMSVVLAETARGPIHEDVGEALINLADFYTTTASYKDADQHYRKALALYESLFGKDNLVAAMIYRVLSEICLAQKRDSEARLLQERSVNILFERRAS